VSKLAGHEQLLELDRALAGANSFEVARVAGQLKVPARGKANIDSVLRPR